MKGTLGPALIGGAIVIAAGLLYLGMREGGEAARDAADTARKTVEGSVDAVSGGVRDGLEGGLRGGINDTTEKVKDAPAEILGDVLGTIRDKAAETAGAARESAARPVDLVTEGIDIFRRGARVATDVLHEALPFSPDEEMQLGRKLHLLYLSEMPEYRDPDALRRIERLARPLLELRDRRQVKYTFTLVDDPAVNAVSLPGGFISVHRGLLEFARDDVELQFVLGHEIGHVDLKHCTRNFTIAARAAQLAGEPAETAIALLYNQYELEFSEDLEFAADEYACRKLLALGHSREEALRFPRRFLDYLKAQGVETSSPARPDTVPQAVEQEIINHFRTHPPSEERLERLRRLRVD